MGRNKMKKIILPLPILVFLLAINIANAQSNELRICVKDSEGNSFPGVNIALLSGDTSVAGGIAGSDGCHTFRSLSNQEYKVRLSFVGYEKIQTATLGEVNSFVLERPVIRLEEILVSAPRPKLTAVVLAEIVENPSFTYGNDNLARNKNEIIQLHSGNSIRFFGVESNFEGEILFDSAFKWYFITQPSHVAEFKRLINRDAPIREIRNFLRNKNPIEG